MRGALPTFYLHLYDVITTPLHQTHLLTRYLQMCFLEMSVCTRDPGTDYIEIVFFSQAVLQKSGLELYIRFTTLFPSISLPNHFESSKHWQ